MTLKIWTVSNGVANLKLFDSTFSYRINLGTLDEMKILIASKVWNQCRDYYPENEINSFVLNSCNTISEK